jgi:hypothetical protein
MIRVLFLFVALSFLAYLGIKFAERVTGKQLLQLTKIAGYSIICSSLAMLVMFGLVVLF